MRYVDCINGRWRRAREDRYRTRHALEAKMFAIAHSDVMAGGIWQVSASQTTSNGAETSTIELHSCFIHKQRPQAFACSDCVEQLALCMHSSYLMSQKQSSTALTDSPPRSRRSIAVFICQHSLCTAKRSAMLPEMCSSTCTAAMMRPRT